MNPKDSVAKFFDQITEFLETVLDNEVDNMRKAANMEEG
jgi:uncharacterized phosphosugar-binding protein